MDKSNKLSDSQRALIYSYLEAHNPQRVYHGIKIIGNDVMGYWPGWGIGVAVCERIGGVKEILAEAEGWWKQIDAEMTALSDEQ